MSRDLSLEVTRSDRNVLVSKDAYTGVQRCLVMFRGIELYSRCPDTCIIIDLEVPRSDRDVWRPVSRGIFVYYIGVQRCFYKRCQGV